MAVVVELQPTWIGLPEQGKKGTDGDRKEGKHGTQSWSDNNGGWRPAHARAGILGFQEAEGRRPSRPPPPGAGRGGIAQ
jgi:hypothetical protein